MKALTLHQPWASLVAIGAKTIETRSWSTSYRGPLAIHAGKKRPPVYVHHNVNDDTPPAIDRIGMPWEWTEHPDDFMHGGAYRWAGPLGSIVATCTLADVVSMVDANGCKDTTKHLCIVNESMLLHSPLDQPWPDGQTEHLVSDQRHYGDFQPGRYAWLLDDVKPLDPIPTVGHQGLWNWAEDSPL